MRGWRPIRTVLAAALLTAATATAGSAAGPCEARDARDPRQISVDGDGLRREFRLSVSDSHIEIVNNCGLEVCNNYLHCENCYSLEKIYGVVKLYDTIARIDLEKSLRHASFMDGLIFSPGIRSVALGESKPIVIGALTGEFTEISFGPDRDGDVLPAIAFYATDGCVTLKGALQAYGRPWTESIGVLKAMVERASVDQISTSPIPPPPAPSPPPTPITMESMRAALMGAPPK